ncbi:TetR-like C-terminal domain-containing protein [Mycolicibacterium smegmatis]|uniref:TetR-like C-terminal domain-containing protein n=1 Tax=Mycolicibacterium smegmatis TaxID=1772 RepID=UPI0013034DD3|nr:TetR-like C-terminal domain-containing protein [Mycolicibacterium smegmatis]
MYRRWPSKAQLVVEAVESLREEPPSVPDDTGDLVGDLISLLDENNSRSAKFNIFAGLVPVLPHDADLAAAVHRRIMRPRAAAVRVAIEPEQTRGGISPDRDRTCSPPPSSR